VKEDSSRRIEGMEGREHGRRDGRRCLKELRGKILRRRMEEGG